MTGDSFFSDGAAAADAALSSAVPGPGREHTLCSRRRPRGTHATLLSSFFNATPVPSIGANLGALQPLARAARIPADDVLAHRLRLDRGRQRGPLARRPPAVHGRLPRRPERARHDSAADGIAAPGRPHELEHRHAAALPRLGAGVRRLAGRRLRRQHRLRLRRHGHERPLRAALRPPRQRPQLRRHDRRAVGSRAAPVLLGAGELRRHRRESDDRGQHVRPAVLHVLRDAAEPAACRHAAEPCGRRRRRHGAPAGGHRVQHRARPIRRIRCCSSIRATPTARRSRRTACRGRWGRCLSSTGPRSRRPRAK